MNKTLIRRIIIVLVLLIAVTSGLFYDQVIVEPSISVKSVSHIPTTINFSGAAASPAEGKTVAIQFECSLSNKSFTQEYKDVEFAYSSPDTLPSFVIGRKLGKTVTKVDIPARTSDQKITLVALVLSDGTDTEEIIKGLEQVPVNIATKKQGGFVKVSKPVFLKVK